MSLLRFFFDQPLAEGHCKLSVDESRHALSVYRLKAGDELTLIDGRGGVGDAVMVTASAKGIECEVRQIVRIPPSTPCELWCAFPRAGGADDVIRRAIEVGATVIRPLLTTRGVWRPDEDRESKQRERWTKIAIAALKQCRAAYLPQWGEPVDVRGLPARDGRFALFGSTREGVELAMRVVARHEADERSIALVGPEGGWTPEEEEALHAWGAHAVSLGSHVLRVETAATVLIALLATRDR